ncbi:MAG TPA: HEAT repeat domain-containing protein [Allosphingosinicella sp.]|uniref:HEAT repeat domain-containing protein n=1 Tax=Allosphingosinicella sp. TaxID=2823234 RepID=UPI002EDAC101
MSTLYALWLVSLIISLIALAIMVGLIIARWISQRRARAREAERRRLVPLLLGGEANGEQLAEAERAPDLLTDLATELIQMVRGEDKENFVASAERLGVAERLRYRLDHGSPRTRLAAAEALADFADDAISMDRLRRALDDPNADVRLAAALALASVGQAPPARELVEKLGLGTHESSALTVGLFEEVARERPGEIRELIEAPDTHPYVKVAAIDALSASGDYSLVPIIAKLVLAAPDDAEELPRYLDALGDFGHPAAASAVSKVLDSPEWKVRAAAAEAAGKIGMTDAANRLAALLSDSHWWVRFRAGEALALLGETGRWALTEAAEHAPEPARSTAQLTLAERGLA